MNLNQLKKFAQGARRKLISEVSSRLDYLTGHDDPYIRAHQEELSEIRRQLEKKSREQLIEEVAYTWFNRIVALRYMDLRGYTKVRVVSPQAGQVQPELLFQIKQGRTPKELRSLQPTFDGYLDGRVSSDQPDREIYTVALLGICNDYSRTLPFLFRKVDEYMAVLLPTDLLSESSIIAQVQSAITEDDVADVEIIGWLYQFYISEKKDQVFGRPKGEKIKKEDIPAATQLFTPHWIVRYMVENSLGRLWRNNRPETGLKQRMEYYIGGDPEPEFLEIEGPEEITLLDPACGSGHILTYAFDLLYRMYEEEGYSAEEIPSLILTNNLYGIDIDTRAAELAAFALTMKAREKDRFFFQRGVVPNVIAMEDVSVDLREAGITMSPQLQEAFGYLTEATNFGSLTPVGAEVQGEIEELLADLEAKGDADLFAGHAMAQVRSGLRQLRYLARRYHCVVTNPPYMNLGNINPNTKSLVESAYPQGKEDLYAAFMSLAERITIRAGLLAMITQQSWMFLPSYTELRSQMLASETIVSMLHLGPRAFETISGDVVQTAAFVIRVGVHASERYQTVFIRLVDVEGSLKRPSFRNPDLRFCVGQRLFDSVPNSPIGYWIGKKSIECFREHPPLAQSAKPRQGVKTGNNELFLRYWHEVSADRMQFPHEPPPSAGARWFPCTKGGSFRRWYGNHEYVLNWEEDGDTIRNYRDSNGKLLSRPQNINYFFRDGITWSSLSGSAFAARTLPKGFAFESKGSAAFPESSETSLHLLGLLNSSISTHFLRVLAPTLDFGESAIGRIPTIKPSKGPYLENVTAAIALSQQDWDSRESSWDFLRSPLLTSDPPGTEDMSTDGHISPSPSVSLAESFFRYVELWRHRFLDLHSMEEANNGFYIDLYELGEDLSSEVPYSHISILQNEVDPKARERCEILFDKREIMKQFVSYGVGCIFGRFSLDKDGLILASAGGDLIAYLAQIPEPTFRPDESGILPITDDNDFTDDLPSQWRTFLSAALGDEHDEENLRFLEDGLGKRLRPYFLKSFYDDHVKRYKKRPIYWLITSPKGTLQALIYLHRYNKDTVNRFLNDYLRPYRQKLEAKRVSAENMLIGGGSSQGEKTKAQKRIDEMRKALEELSTWERDVVRPVAEKRIELDLDDGVKVNYGKLGAILAPVKGLNA